MPDTLPIPQFAPRVKGATTSQSPNVGTLMDQLDEGRYYVPDYQRDSSQWDLSKRSLFIDSLINNLTIPPLIVYPETDEQGGERFQIVDGQQRLTTIRDFLKGNFSLGTEADVEYADNVGALIQGKRFDQLPEMMKKQIKYYVLNIIILPKDLDLGLRLEIFRRINEAGVPLSPHDLRLAVFGQSDRVYFIRLAGVFDPEREGAVRMIGAAKAKHQLEYPWADGSAWKSWWADSALAAGQAPSQMFLYYVIASDLEGVERLLASNNVQDKLGLRYDRTTVSVLDLYVAQLQNEALNPNDAPKLLVDLATMKNWFALFEIWFNIIKTAKVPRIATNSSTKIALFIAAASRVWTNPEDVTEKQWQLIQIFLTQGPGKIEEAVGLSYTITKGKWPGQKTQIEKAKEICQIIASQ
jgi:hypothetical protein